MLPRDPHQHHRVATPLELFFDLCFVVAVAQAATSLHHDIARGVLGGGALCFAMTFFAIWWAWMNFTWFASAYDVDDAGYRVLVFVQMIGVLVISAGVPRAFHHDWDVVTVGYAIMRSGLVALWLRAAAGDPRCRRTCHRMAIGVSLCQIAWLSLLLVPDDVRLYAWFAIVPVELLVPVWAERAGNTTWHPHHIAERYSLLTLIVLGESVLAASFAIQAALDAGYAGAELYAVVVGAPFIMFSMWWIYFDRTSHAPEKTNTDSWLWAYGHYFIFASTAAVGAGLAVAVDHAEHGKTSHWIAGGAVAIPVAVYVLVVWFVLIRRNEPRLARSLAFPIAAVLALGSMATGYAVPLVGGLLAGLVAYSRLYDQASSG